MVSTLNMILAAPVKTACNKLVRAKVPGWRLACRTACIETNQTYVVTYHN